MRGEVPLAPQAAEAMSPQRPHCPRAPFDAHAVSPVSSPMEAMEEANCEWDAVRVSLPRLPSSDYRRLDMPPLGNAIFGEVVLHEHVPSSTTVVVKTMQMTAKLFDRKGKEDVAEREIRTHQHLRQVGEDCPNIIRYLGAYEARDEEAPRRLTRTTSNGSSQAGSRQALLVTEFANGGELSELFHDPSALPAAKFKDFAKQFLNGVAFLHRHGVAHRDLSLENTVVHADTESDGSAQVLKIIDFGHAVPAGSPASGSVGRDYYRAPEMYPTGHSRVERSYDPAKADMFACGVVLFIMMTGVPPWEKAMPSDERYNVLQAQGVQGLLRVWGLPMPEEDEPLHANGDGPRPSCLDLVTSMLSERPSQRPSAKEALAHDFFTQRGGRARNSADLSL